MPSFNLGRAGIFDRPQTLGRGEQPRNSARLERRRCDSRAQVGYPLIPSRRLVWMNMKKQDCRYERQPADPTFS
jgi:hypothetical protein